MKKFLLVIITFCLSITLGFACTRAVYIGKNNVVTGRTMDWKEKMYTDLWFFPRGMERNGETGSNSLKWTSKYGSVIASAYNIASTDGLNEKGLAANLLWLEESVYQDRDPSKPGLTIAAWVQYFLDNFATVDEAVADFQKGTFQLVTDMMPDGERAATLHLTLSDSYGDSAVFEFVGKELHVYHGKQYIVMTNSPTYNLQMSINDYWQKIGGLNFLPGTNKSTDRFSRAFFYINALPKDVTQQIAVAGVLSVMRNVSVPYGIAVENNPEISTTQWRTISDNTNCRYFFESTITPNVFWVSLNDIDFAKETKVKKLSLANDEVYSGDAFKDFKLTKPFTFLGPKDNR